MAARFDSGSFESYGAVEATGTNITVPDANLLFTGDFSRSGSDLIITGSEGAKFVVAGYFNTDNPPSLLSPEGAMLTGDVVSSLAGPQFPGQYAQAGGGGQTGQEAIGKVQTLDGSATVVRANGTTETLNNGDPVFQGDVVSTGPGSKMGIGFVDGTVFSLSANARMVLNSLIYDPDGKDNSMLFSLVEGTFVFAAGQIAPNGDMKINTPVATMGIRGTAPTVNIDSASGQVNFSIIPDPGDGHIGSYTLYSLDTGQPIGTISTVGTKWQITSATGQVTEVEKSQEDLLNDAEAIGQINNVFNTYQTNSQGPQAGPENGPPSSSGLDTTPSNPGSTSGDNNNPNGQGGGDNPPPPPSGNENENPPPPPPPPGPPEPGPESPPEATGPNVITGTGNADVLNGTNGVDHISGLGGKDFIFANGGDDKIFISSDDGDVIDGGEGTDTLVFEGDLNIDTKTTELEANNIEIIDLNNTHENTLTISADDIAGANVENVLQIRGGTDEAEGPNDTVNLTTEFYVEGDEGDEFVAGNWQLAAEPFVAPDGTIFDVYEFIPTGSETGEPLATAQIEQGIDVTVGQTVIGSNDSETPDELQGGPGNDIIKALGGDDTIIGGSGEGDDDYDGGQGTDTVIYTSTSLGIVINLVDSTVTGPEIGFDTIARLERFVAGDGNDSFIFAADTGWFFDGGIGFDTIHVDGGLDIDTSTFNSDAENIEAIDLNHTDANTLTISVDDIFDPDAVGDEDYGTMRINGGANAEGPNDVVNLTNEFIPDGSPDLIQSLNIEGGDLPTNVGAFNGNWFATGTQVLDGITYNNYNFEDPEGNILALAHIEQGIDVNIGVPVAENLPSNVPDFYAGALDADDSSSDSIPDTGSSSAPSPEVSDYWAFYAVAGQTVTVQAARGETALDPALWVFSGLVSDPSAFGPSLSHDDPGFIDFADDEISHPGPFGDPLSTFTAPTTGYYTAIVTNFASGSDDGDGQFPYTIQVSGNSDLPMTSSQLESFENGFEANNWQVINAAVSSDNSTDGSFSARITTLRPGDDDEDVPDGQVVERQNVDEIAQQVGVPVSTLDSLADTPNDPGYVTEGGAITTSFFAHDGQVLSFDWFFNTEDYIDEEGGVLNDYAFAVIDGEVVKLFDVETSGNTEGNTATEGWNSFSIVLDGTGNHTVSFGVLDDSDTAVETSLNIDNIWLGSNDPEIPILGGPGNDILIGGTGDATFTGGEGSDKFVLNNLGEGLSTITDFGPQDSLDLTGLLDGAFNPATDNIGDFVQFSQDQSGNNTSIRVDLDGEGTEFSPVEVAVLQNVGAGIGISLVIGNDDFVVNAAVDV